MSNKVRRQKVRGRTSGRTTPAKDRTNAIEFSDPAFDVLVPVASSVGYGKIEKHDVIQISFKTPSGTFLFNLLITNALEVADDIRTVAMQARGQQGSYEEKAASGLIVTDRLPDSDDPFKGI